MLLICGANMSEYETSVGVTEHGQHVGRGIVGRTQAPQAIISNIIQDSLPGQFVNNSYYLPALDSISKIQFGDFWASGCLYNTKSPIKIQKSPEKIRIQIISQTIYKISFIKQPRVDMIERYFHSCHLIPQFQILSTIFLVPQQLNMSSCFLFCYLDT